MQRQSLGSPSRERLTMISADDVVLTADDLHNHHRRRDSLPSSFSSSAIAAASSAADTTVSDDDELVKTLKPNRSSQSSSPENYIHLIPILIVFCFFVLYLSSHDPSPQDLAQFHGFQFKLPEESTLEMNGIEEVNTKNKVLKRSNAFAIRSLTNLQEEEEEEEEEENSMRIDSSEAATEARSHRKLGDF